MRAALFRNIAIVMFTKRGKKVITLCGALLLCFISTLLLDWRLYLSATLTGILAAATLTVFAVQHFRQRHYKREREQRRVVYEREREQRKVAKATRRIETAKAHHEKFERAKASLAGAATGLSSGAAGFASMAKTGASNGAAAVARVAKISLTGVRDRLGSCRSKVAPSSPSSTKVDVGPYKREREQRKVAKATRRIETAKARHEKFERAKASLAGAATGLSSGAAGFASMAKTGVSNGAAAVGGVAKISLTGVRRLGSWRSKVAPGAAFVTDASGTTTLLPGIPIFETPPAQASGDAVQWVPDRQREQMFGAKQQVPHGGQCD
jgi:L-lactate utilization protein LutC